MLCLFIIIIYFFKWAFDCVPQWLKKNLISLTILTCACIQSPGFIAAFLHLAASSATGDSWPSSTHFGPLHMMLLLPGKLSPEPPYLKPCLAQTAFLHRGVRQPVPSSHHTYSPKDSQFQCAKAGAKEFVKNVASPGRPQSIYRLI